MAAGNEIAEVVGREILDSRGNPTVEVDVRLQSGALGRAAVPSGASTGSREAREIRDGDAGRYRGRGVLRAVAAVNGEIRDAVRGMDAEDFTAVDGVMIELDGTPMKDRLGANSLLGVSLAAVRAVANARGISPFEYLAPAETYVLPVPLMNVLNGGQHAANDVEVQEFMIVPDGAPSFSEALRWGVEVYHALGTILREGGWATGVGDEGGFAPDLDGDEGALVLLERAIEAAGYRPGEDVHLALDVAASELWDGVGYRLGGEILDSGELIDRYAEWCRRFPLVSIEDGMAEDDWAGWVSLTSRLGERVQLVGDDLFVTDSATLEEGARLGAGTAILIKPNQIGTVSETLATLATARRLGYGACISHRSGETVDAFIADLAVSSGAGQIKTGAPCRGERVEKYNQLLRIEGELGERARFAGSAPFVLQ